MSDRELFSSDLPRSTRSFAGVAISVAVHAVAAGLVYVAGLYLADTVAPDTGRIAQRLTFVHVAPPELLAKPIRLKVPPLPKKPPPTPQPLPKLHRAELEPVAPKPVVRAEPPKPAPRPIPAPVTVGAFSTPVAQIRAPEPNRVVQSAAFNTPSSKAPSPELKLGAAKVGGFQSAAAADVRSGAERGAATVVDAGFGHMGNGSRPIPTARTVGDVGFGSTGSTERAAPRAQVQPVGFGNAEPAPIKRSTPAPERVETAVEILVKPTPEYTSEARQRKIEGEVSLEVEFRASGEIRVLRVVRGLGYGLDESATRAAERIKFKPARSSSGPVDFRAIVQIVFRLT